METHNPVRLSGVAPVAASGLVDDHGGAETTITNRTWFNVKFTLGVGLFLRTYVLRPAESFSGRDLGGLRVTYHDGCGRSSQSLQSGQNYHFVELDDLFLLEKTW